MSTSTSLSVPYNACNNQNLTLFDLSAFKLLETISIGMKNCKYVSIFNIDGLFKLRSLQISEQSFTETGKCGNNPSKSFHVINCMSLKSLNIAFHSFMEYAGDFDLRNLPLLESISIGSGYTYDSAYNFCHASLQLRSTTLICYIFIDLPKLKSIFMSQFIFTYSHATVFEGKFFFLYIIQIFPLFKILNSIMVYVPVLNLMTPAF